jgi:transcriptional regulator with XRE-family HTH domain
MAFRPLIELREYRENQNPRISQREMAEVLGVTRVTVARWEMGLRRPDREFIPELSRITGRSPAELLGVDA